jgi:hypothetical protein
VVVAVLMPLGGLASAQSAVGSRAAGAAFANAAAAARTVNQSFVCRGDNVGGVNALIVSIGVTRRRPFFAIATGDRFVLGDGDLEHGRPNGKINFDPRHCTARPPSTPLTRGTLPLTTRLVADKSFPRGVGDRFACWTSLAIVHARVVFDSAGVPTAEVITITNGRSMKPLSFIRLEPPHYARYSASPCTHAP